MEYFEAFADLAEVDLSESYVVELAPMASGVALRIDAVLTPNHSRYAPPRPGEAYCHRPGWLTVLGTDGAEVDLSGARPDIDPDGTRDHGQVDVFAEVSPGLWELEGSWGRVRVVRPQVRLELDD